jgi:lipid-A-disaccharide synthase
MRIFISAGEPSGDMHGANLVRALRRARPDLVLDGFGGDQMAAAGCSLVYPLCDMAMIGLLKVALNVHRFKAILSLAERFFREHRPDVVVLIDFPGFHWWLARAARAQGVPVLYFVPPQIWAWARWRARKMKRLVNHVLCALPFEEPWYRQRYIPASFIGHPYFDALHQQRLDADFLAQQKARPETIIGLLPGSRRQELENNTESLLRAAEIIHRERPDTRFLVACLKPAHRDTVLAKLGDCPAPVEVHAGRTPEIIHLAHSCLSVSGSVSLELLHAEVPSVVLFRVHWFSRILGMIFQRTRYISLVNLLANRELYPEFLCTRCPAEGMASVVLRWLNDPVAYHTLKSNLHALREQVAKPGACARGAASILEMAERLKQGRRIAA